VELVVQGCGSHVFPYSVGSRKFRKHTELLIEGGGGGGGWGMYPTCTTRFMSGERVLGRDIFKDVRASC